jgi:peptide/nickel transport system substrate-binding protein
MAYSWLRKPKFLVFVPLALLLVIALACGDDDTPTPSATSTPVPATEAPAPTATTEARPTATPTATLAPGAPTRTPEPPTATAAPGRPTAIPTPTPLPAATELGPPTPTAPPVQQELEPIYGGLLPMAQISDCRSFDPFRALSLVDLTCSAPYYHSLLEFDPLRPGVLKCDACTEFSVSQDGKEITFKLHQGIMYTNGSELTAEDVKFSFDRAMDPDQPRPKTAILSSYIERNEVVDKYTVRMIMKAARPSFLRVIGRDYHKIQSKAWVEAGNDPHQAATTMGSGPFMFVNFDEAVSHEGEKNPNYFHEGKPYLDGYKSFILTDPGTEIAAYTTERILFTHHTQAGIADLNRFARDNSFLAKFDIFFQPGINGVHLVVNANKPPYDDPRVREAIDLALHRQPIIATIGGGRYSIGKPMGPNNPMALPDEEILARPGYRELNGEKHPDDIARARELWAAAGFSASNPLTGTIVSPDAKPHPDLAQVYKAQMEEVLEHVELTFMNMELGAWFADMIAGKFDITASGNDGGISDPDDRFSQLFLKVDRNFSDQEIPGIRDLWEAQSKEFDDEKRRDINYEMQRLYLNTAPATMPIAWETQGIFVHKRLMTKAGVYVLSEGRENAMQLYHIWLLPEAADRPSIGADPGFGGT